MSFGAKPRRRIERHGFQRNGKLWPQRRESATRNHHPYYTRGDAPWDDFAPRIGFAWQPTSSNRLVLRGGAEFFYDVPTCLQTAAFYNGGPLHAPSANGAPAASLFCRPKLRWVPPFWVDPSTVVSVAQNPLLVLRRHIVRTRAQLHGIRV